MKINPIIFTFISNYHEHFTYLKNVFSKLTYFLELITKIAFNVMLKYIMLECIHTILCHEVHACASSVVYIYIYIQGGRGQWAVYYTSPKSFIITFSYSMA